MLASSTANRDAASSDGGADARDASPMTDEPENVPSITEVVALTEALYERSGVDFRDYAPASLLRRVKRCMSEEGVSTVAELRARACADADCLSRLLSSLVLPVTSMFRDPSFFRAFRENVCPVLATYPFLRLWVAGCSSGQEAYSLAIVLEEAGLYERSRIYATDLHAGLLQQARGGIYPLAAVQEYSRHYGESGGQCDFADYFIADREYAMLRPQLRANLVFAPHDLGTDASFNEFHVILCRNVMIYFNERLQQRVHRLLYDSLGMLGFLALGRSESIRFSCHETSYETVSKAERIYRKVA